MFLLAPFSAMFLAQPYFGQSSMLEGSWVTIRRASRFAAPRCNLLSMMYLNSSRITETDMKLYIPGNVRHGGKNVHIYMNLSTENYTRVRRAGEKGTDVPRQVHQL